MSHRPQDAVYPPCTLDAGRAQWTAQDKLARLVTRAREIGYCSDPADAFPEALAEERALFEELAALLAEREELIEEREESEALARITAVDFAERIDLRKKR